MAVFEAILGIIFIPLLAFLLVTLGFSFFVIYFYNIPDYLIDKIFILFQVLSAILIGILFKNIYYTLSYLGILILISLFFLDWA